MKRDSDLDELHKDGAFFYMADDCFSSATGTSSGYHAPVGLRKRLAVAAVGCAHDVCAMQEGRMGVRSSSTSTMAYGMQSTVAIEAR